MVFFHMVRTRQAQQGQMPEKMPGQLLAMCQWRLGGMLIRLAATGSRCQQLRVVSGRKCPPHPDFCDDFLKDLRLDLSKTCYYILCFSQGKIQPIRKRNSNQSGKNAAIQQETPASQKRQKGADQKESSSCQKDTPASQHDNSSISKTIENCKACMHTS